MHDSYPGFDARFIPVCTGNSSGVYPAGMLMQVHPRVYGELVLVVRVKRDV